MNRKQQVVARTRTQAGSEEFSGAVRGGRLRPAAVKCFREAIYRHFRRHRRRFPWRNTRDPYHVLVSEVMLQQTQTDRVVQKYEQFVCRFPDVGSLAQASLHDVLRQWQGLGHNRRALALRETAQFIVKNFSGRLPSSVEELSKLRGVGRATASSIAAFAFNMPTVFIETNIRTVFIHLFFKDRSDVKDAELLPLVAQTLDTACPRRWYNALMDYGAMLKKLHGNPSRRSLHHKTQSAFEGSDRQLRGRILKSIIEGGPISERQLLARLNAPRERVQSLVEALEAEGFLKRKAGRFAIG